jgi:tetratricopeptide (TPR) repeat protein
MRAAHVIPALSVVLVACGGELDTQAPRAAGTPLVASLATISGPSTAALRAGRTSDARSALEASLARDPDAPGALNDLALTYATQERFDAARQLLEEALARGGGREQQAALVNLAELYALDGYLSAAQAHLDSARAVDASRPEPLYALALLADARGDRGGAASSLAAAFEADRSGAVRRDLVSIYPEERVHLDALVAEASGDGAAAQARWRELARGRFPSLAQAAARHLEGP